MSVSKQHKITMVYKSGAVVEASLPQSIVADIQKCISNHNKKMDEMPGATINTTYTGINPENKAGIFLNISVLDAFIVCNPVDKIVKD